MTSNIASDLDKRARELALEVVRRYLPDESPDVGRGRRCCEYIETHFTAALQAERERFVGIVEKFGANIRKVDLLAAITAEPSDGDK